MIVQPDLRGTAVAFLRRKVLFVLVVTVVCAAGGAWLLLARPIYESGASLVVHFDTQSVPNIDRTITPTMPLGSNERREIIYSDADILRSRDVIREAIKALGVDRVYGQEATVYANPQLKFAAGRGHSQRRATAPRRDADP